MIEIKLRQTMFQLLLMFCMLKKRYPSYVSKHNSNGEKHIVFLMISNGEKLEAKYQGQWYYLALNNY